MRSQRHLREIRGRDSAGKVNHGRFVVHPSQIPAAAAATTAVGDLTFSLVALGLPWLPVNATYSEATYPELAALFTVTGGNFTVPDQPSEGYLVYIYSGVE